MPYRILLIDDSPEDRASYGRFLLKGNPEKYRLVEAGSIEEGLHAYREEATDLILLDYQLPDGTGLDFIDESEDEIDCPIVVLTGQGNERIAVEVMKAGAADYLVKGQLNADLLRRAVRSAIEKHSLVKTIERNQEEQRLITNLALKIRKSLNLSEILATTTTEIRTLIAADRVLIYRFRSDAGGSIVAGSTAAPWPECPPIPIEDTYLRGNEAGRYLAGEVKAIADVGAMDYPRCYLELLQRFEVKAHAIAPILLGPVDGAESGSERLWGLLIVHQCSGPRPWRASEVECLRQLSVQLGIAIAQAELYENARNLNERLERSVALRTRELVEAREKLNLVIEGSGDGVWYFDIPADLLYLSPRYQELLGYDGTKEVWTWEEWIELLHPDDREAFERSHFRHLKPDAGLHEFEFRLRYRDGEYKWFYARGKAVHDLAGRAIRMAGSATDISERKRLEEQLRTTNEILNRIYDNSPVGMSLVDERGRYLRVNRELAEINGYSIEEHIGRPIGELLPDIAPRLTELLQQIRESGQAVSGIEIEGTTPALPDVKRHWIGSYYPVDLPDGQRGIGAIVTEITAQKKIEAALVESEEKFRQIAETIQEIFWIFSPGLEKVIYISPAFQEIVGYRVEALYKNPLLWLEVIHPEDRERARSRFLTAIARGDHDTTYRIIRPDGQIRWIHERAFPRRNREGEFDRIIGIAHDITERKCLEDSLFQEKELAEITLKSIGDAAITTDALGRVTYLNPVAEQLLGCRGEEVMGDFLSDIFALQSETTRETVENPVDRVLRERMTVRLEEGTILIARDGREFAVADTAAPILDRTGKMRGTVLIFNDVTASRLLTRQLRVQAEHDALTGLFNRFYLERELSRTIADAIADPTLEHTLCYLDLDRFKIVNDTCGHAAGDELLRQLSATIGRQIRSTDTLARLGGDEFALILYHCPLARAREIAGAILSAVRDFQFARDGKIFKIGVSIGIVSIDSTVESATTVMSAADAACYSAKEAGRDRFHIYRENDENFSRMRQERQWVLEIRGAIEENRLFLYHQAIVPARADVSEPPFSEILLRLKLRDGRLVTPMAFLPAAERYGLMLEIDRAVLGLLFHYLEGLSRASPVDRACYMVNLSGASVSDESFLEFIIGEMRARSIVPGSIGFEITETVAISNFAVARKFIERLREFGCRFALDDFGSGMSSFGYLKSLPVDYVKIDGYFVRDILEDPVDRAIVSSIDEIASLLDIRTIAEFVENEAIRERLIEIGIDYVQGYGVSPVLSLARED